MNKDAIKDKIRALSEKGLKLVRGHMGVRLEKDGSWGLQRIEGKPRTSVCAIGACVLGESAGQREVMTALLGMPVGANDLWFFTRGFDGAWTDSNNSDPWVTLGREIAAWARSEGLLSND